MTNIIIKPELYLEDSYLKEFDAIVTDIKDDKFVSLNQSAFYPAGGGQPSDTGKLIRIEDNQEFTVIFVGKFGGGPSHEINLLDKNNEIINDKLKIGDKVKGIIDWKRRYKLMRMHSASHVLSSIFHEKSGAKITGNQLKEDKSRIDFSLENFNKEKISEYVRIANQKISENQAVSIEFKPREEVMNNPNLIRLANALPPNIQVLRIVKIGDIDIQADGGTHVKNTKEIGSIEIVKMENKGKNNRRIYFTLKDN